MPTPVSTARQCLTQESGEVLDDAVAIARRRGHTQTTSLHAVSALLSLPSSALREACARGRSNSYSSRMQFKALELCLSVSLDRLPSSAQRPTDDEPPVSNSFMAAIKRSQANQRRQPENYYLYQQQQQQQASILTVKVELQNLIISILDDPVVSRVFGEAGFRNCDIKLAILRPVHQIFRYKRPTPMFLSDFGDEYDMGFRGFSFPFSCLPGFLDVDDYFKRIGEILKRGRNPILVGVSALNVLKKFLEMVQRRRGLGDFSVEFSGLSVLSLENEILEFVNKNYDVGMVKSRFDEVGKTVEQSLGPGVIINFGDMKILFGKVGVGVDAVNFIVSELSRLMEIHRNRVCLIGFVSEYETYSKFVNRFPSTEKGWDLQLLPITSFKTPLLETYPISSLTESFVPLGGFFSTPSDLKIPLSGSTQSTSRCHLCNEKFEQELTALSKGGFTASNAYQYPSSLPSWLEKPELNTNKVSDIAKVNDSMVLSAQVVRLQKKWDNICQRLHYAPFLAKPDTYRACSQAPTVVGFQVKDKKEIFSSNDKVNASPNVNGSNSMQSCKLMDLEQNATRKTSSPVSVISTLINANFSKAEDDLGGIRSPYSMMSSSSVGEDLTSPTSVTSVTTDLGLRIDMSMSKVMEKTSMKTCGDLLQNLSGCFYANENLVTASTINHTSNSSSCPISDIYEQLDQKDFKKLYTSLAGKIGRQEEAVIVISRTIARCKTRNEKHQGTNRGDIWFNFHGPDRLCKKKIAVALAEILYGGTESFICVDLSFGDSLGFTVAEMNDSDLKFRRKTILDCIADELRKKPLSIVYLENIDESDPQVQNSLSYALRSGRLSDSHGREVGIGNAVFVATSRFMEGNNVFSSTKETINYSEENVLNAKGRPIQIVIGFDLGENFICQNSKVSSITKKDDFNPVFLNKRKLIGNDGTIRQHKSLEVAKRAHTALSMSLDLNVPSEECEINNVDKDPTSENSKTWLEDFSKQVDETVIFKPFDFDALAENLLKEITQCFYNVVGSEGSLEVDSQVMLQILAEVCLSDSSNVDKWINNVLGEAFVEAQKRYNLSSRSVVKLVSCEGEDVASGVLLPTRIAMK